MKKNGIEVRANGSEIHRRLVFGYDVKIRMPSGELKPSRNGPWDYLYDARADADAGAMGVNAEQREGK